MADVTLRVEGLRELNRAFKVADVVLHREMRQRLRDAAEPVRVDAESFAVAGIPRIGLRWSQMRVGVTTRMVYVAPKQRRRGGSGRPNLAQLLAARAMDPAAEKGAPGVVDAMEDLLNDVARAWERV